MADAKTEPAFVLPGEGSGPVHFGGFPGVWTPGQPIAVAELGFATLTDARAARRNLARPLEEIKVETGSAPMPPRPNHSPSQRQTLAGRDE